MKDILIKRKKLIKAFIAVLLFLSSKLIQLLMVQLLHVDLKKITYKEAIPLSCFASFVIAICLIILYKDELKKDWKIYKKDITNNIDTAFKYWILGFVFMVFSNLIINFVFNAGQANNEQTVQKMIQHSPILLLISAGLLAPIVEEIVFRKTFKDNIKNKYIFIILSSLVFGYLHVMDSDTILQFLYIIPYSSLGIAFAKAYSETDTIFTSISMHMFHNTMLTLISILI